MSKPIYHSVLDDTFKRPWNSARLFVDKIPFGTSKEELEQFFTLRHDLQALLMVWIYDVNIGGITFAKIDFNTVDNAALFLDKDLSGPIKYKQTRVDFLSNGNKYKLLIKPVEPAPGLRGQSFNDRQTVVMYPVVYSPINNVITNNGANVSYLVNSNFTLFNKPQVSGTQFPSVDSKWDFCAKLSLYNIPLIIEINHSTKNRLNIEFAACLELMMETAIRIGCDNKATVNDGCVNLLLGNFKLRHRNTINLSYAGKTHDLSPSGLAAARIDKLYVFSPLFYDFVLSEQFARDLDESFTPKVNSINVKSFFEYCFDGVYQSRTLKAFTISNYGQKLFNELENSNYTINDINITKILTELALYANHYFTTHIYQTVLRSYLDPRIFIGFCLRTGFDYTVFYSPSKFKVIGTWLTNWVNNDNLNIAKNFKYD